MRYTRFICALLAVLLLTSWMAGCSGKEPEPEPTAAETTAPTQSPTPTDPTEPAELTAHQKLVAYLQRKGPVAVEQSAYTFTMSAEGDKILWAYHNDSTDITVTLTDGAASHPVTIKFNVYDATANVETATFSGVNPQLSDFYCWVAAMAEPLRRLATTAVASCFDQAADLMEPSGVNLVDLGFVHYFN